MSEECLGDGLYARYDGYAITLRAPRPAGDHYVCLEAPAFDAFIAFVRRRGIVIDNVNTTQEQ